jgi:hypothetical protein
MSDLANDSAAAPLHATPATFRHGNLAISGDAAELVQHVVADLAHAAYQAQGPRAFEDPKSSAVVHEAGHAVLFACSGFEMRFVKVWQGKKGIRRGHWIGKGQPVEEYFWHSGPNTSPEEDFRNACIQLAGWMAEVLFDSENLRLGSSLDERTQAILAAHNISRKTGADPHQVGIAICAVTSSILQKNESVVREIASVLNRNGSIRGEALSAILARVERPS